MTPLIIYATDEKHARNIISRAQGRGFFLAQTDAIGRDGLWMVFRSREGVDFPVPYIRSIYRAHGNFSQAAAEDPETVQRQDKTIEALIAAHTRMPNSRDDEVLIVAPATDRVVWLGLGVMLDPTRRVSATADSLEELTEPEPVERKPPAAATRSAPPKQKRGRQKQDDSNETMGRIDAAAALALTPPPKGYNDGELAESLGVPGNDATED